jgi:hypothetical protein
MVILHASAPIKPESRDQERESAVEVLRRVGRQLGCPEGCRLRTLP